MTATHVQQDRITFSLPSTMNQALDRLKEEKQRSKSDLIQRAIALYLEEEKQAQLERSVELLADVYAEDKELTEMTVLDGEAFL